MTRIASFGNLITTQSKVLLAPVHSIVRLKDKINTRRIIIFHSGAQGFADKKRETFTLLRSFVCFLRKVFNFIHSHSRRITFRGTPFAVVVDVCGCAHVRDNTQLGADADSFSIFHHKLNHLPLTSSVRSLGLRLKINGKMFRSKNKVGGF